MGINPLTPRPLDLRSRPHLIHRRPNSQPRILAALPRAHAPHHPHAHLRTIHHYRTVPKKSSRRIPGSRNHARLHHPLPHAKSSPQRHLRPQGRSPHRTTKPANHARYPSYHSITNHRFDSINHNFTPMDTRETSHSKPPQPRGHRIQTPITPATQEHDQ